MNYEELLQRAQQMEKELDDLTERGIEYKIIYLEASERVLIRRFNETRRKHPLAEDKNTVNGIRKEKELMQSLRDRADYIIDTTNLLTRELKAELDRIFVNNEKYNSLMINIMSFGFKHGIPQEADLVFDVRFLPNPFYLDELKHKTGLDKEVQDYVMSNTSAVEYLKKMDFSPKLLYD